MADLIDIYQRMYLVYSSFNLQAHADWMKTRHPNWSERQCRNVLYWQNMARADLRRTVAAAMSFLHCDAITYCPEGLGVNVFATARLAGLKLDKTRRLRIDHHIAIIGMRREKWAE